MTNIFSVQIITQRAWLKDCRIMALLFWYSIIGVITSFILSATFETLTLPTTSLDWLLFAGHCFGSAGVVVFGTIAQDLGSFIVTSLAFTLAIFFYFLAQYVIFQKITCGWYLYLELTGAVLTVISSILVPLYELVTHNILQNKD